MFLSNGTKTEDSSSNSLKESVLIIEALNYSILFQLNHREIEKEVSMYKNFFL